MRYWSCHRWQCYNDIHDVLKVKCGGGTANIIKTTYFRRRFLLFNKLHSSLTKKNYIHTYIIGHYNPSVRIIDLVSHTTYVVCVNFIHKWRWTYSLKSTPNDRFFWETFHDNFINFSEFLPEICWEEIAEEILLVFRLDVGPGTRTLAFQLISQYTTY